MSEGSSVSHGGFAVRVGEYGPLAEAYDRDQTPDIRWVWDRLKEHLYLVNEQPEDTAVLDLGCGTGLSTRGLRRDGFTNVVGVDPDPAMLAVARRTAPTIPYVEARADSLPFPDNSFDVVTIYWAFQNFGGDEKSMREIRRVLRPGGICMVITGTTEGFVREGRVIIRKYVTLPRRFPPGYIHDGERFAVFLEKHGFTSVATYELGRTIIFTVDDALRSFAAATKRNYVSKEDEPELDAELTAFCKRLAEEDIKRGGVGLLYKPYTLIVDIAETK